MLLSAYVGLTPLSISAINDKLLHFFDFFLLTVSIFRLYLSDFRLLNAITAHPLLGPRLSKTFPDQGCIDINRCSSRGI